MAFDFTNPFGLVQSQPSLNLPTGLISTTPQEKLNPMAGAKNDKLALMLHALGGALRGDQGYIQNTLQLQQMQENKKKEAEKKAKQEQLKKDQEEFIKNNPELAGAIRMNQLFGFTPPAKKNRDSYVAKDGYRYYVDGKQERVFPGVTVTETQSQEDIYKENAARIKNTILTKGVDALTENEKSFYNDYIKRTGGNPFNQVMADMFLDNNPGTQRNKPKSYKVINNSYGNASAESIIKQAMELNDMTREEVIRNLKANNIIAE